MDGSAPWLTQLSETPLSERSRLLEALVAAEFRAWLLMSEADVLPLDESYFALGLTSLGAVEIQERLQSMIGRRIDSASLFNNPTIHHLLAFMRTEVLPEFFISSPRLRDNAATPPEIASTEVASTEGIFASERQSPKDLLDDVLKDLYAS
jgi:hypothetical protein